MISESVKILKKDIMKHEDDYEVIDEIMMIKFVNLCKGLFCFVISIEH